jgi:hypothetical protein
MSNVSSTTQFLWTIFWAIFWAAFWRRSLRISNPHVRRAFAYTTVIAGSEKAQQCSQHID